MDTYRGPHHSNQGKRLARRKRVIIRRAGDQVSGEPMEVVDQSKARIRSPISPPPVSQPAKGSAFVTSTLTNAEQSNSDEGKEFRLGTSLTERHPNSRGCTSCEFYWRSRHRPGPAALDSR